MFLSPRFNVPASLVCVWTHVTWRNTKRKLWSSSSSQWLSNDCQEEEKRRRLVHNTDSRLPMKNDGLFFHSPFCHSYTSYTNINACCFLPVSSTGPNICVTFFSSFASRWAVNVSKWTGKDYEPCFQSTEWRNMKWAAIFRFFLPNNCYSHSLMVFKFKHMLPLILPFVFHEWEESEMGIKLCKIEMNAE